MPIEQLSVGDLVLAKNEITGEQAFKPVEVVYENQVEEVIAITVGGTEIVTTPLHPFWVKEKGWVNAGELMIGDEFELSNKSLLAVERVDWRQESTAVYNISVNEFHTFYATNLGILTHNASCIPADVYYKQTKDRITAPKGSNNSKILGEQLQKAGLYPDPNTIEKWEAHHIVPFKDSRYTTASNARTLLENKFGIDLNSAANGIWLPVQKDVPSFDYIDWDNVLVTLPNHRTVHTPSYYEYVFEELNQVYTNFGPNKEKAILALNEIRRGLMDGSIKLSMKQ
jgi:hypothetical protein